MTTISRLVHGPVHQYFGLSYAHYLVRPRVLLQSMPPAWQQRFVCCLDELDAAFDHLDLPSSYEITPGEEHYVTELDQHELREAGITVEHEAGESCYYDHNGDQLEPDLDRVLLPRDTDLPHYKHGFVDPDEESLLATAKHHATAIPVGIPDRMWTRMTLTPRFGRWVNSTAEHGDLVVLGHHDPAAALASAYAELIETARPDAARELLAPGAEHAVESGFATHDNDRGTLAPATAQEDGAFAVTWIRPRPRPDEPCRKDVPTC